MKRGYLEDLNRRLPLTIKMVVLTFAVGLIVWFSLDSFLTYRLENIFHTRVTEELAEHAVEDLLNLDHYMKNMQAGARLFVTQKGFSDYIDGPQRAAGDERVDPHVRPPAWFPESTVINAVTEPRYILLLDRSGRVKEVYQGRENALPSSLLAGAGALAEKGRDRVLITEVDNVAYAATSAAYSDARNRPLAMLLMVSPIDDDFLNAALGGKHDHLAALITAEADPRIITSNDPGELPSGTRLSSLRDRYLVTAREIFNYGETGPQIKFISFASKAEVGRLVGTVIEEAQHERAMSAFLLILTFVLIMYLITRHIEVITRHIMDFSERTLGMKTKELPRGDQLHVLEEMFRDLTVEVAMSREIIKSQAEEKTRVIVNNAFNAIITTDEKGVIETWNPRAEALFGRPFEEAVGRPVHDIIVAPQQHERCRETIRNIMSEGDEPVSREHIEITCVNSSGHEFPAEFSVSKARSGNEHIYIFIIRDVTERAKADMRIKKLLEKVVKTKTEWELTFNSVNEMIALVDKENNIIRCNRSFAEFIKSPAEQLAGKKCSDSLICNLERPVVLGRAQKGAVMEKVEIKTENGKWLYVSHLPVFDEKKEFLYTIIMATDISELKKTQQAVIESKLELRERVGELENFYEMAVNRELKMIALKREIAKLKGKAQNNEPGEDVKGGADERTIEGH